ncbi:hypothetical protein SKAU_G00245610 [Synaphobranchus kaupii]|uniref:Uncharacterized protein n=1 Tax=Synaphobranchus kaupii TaxID=118154 RepID=A0A9Q1IQG3_SYNKA|nr:hypothetical protein SKAU_G00245610 [Synaphobranchus kaupii]
MFPGGTIISDGPQSSPKHNTELFPKRLTCSAPSVGRNWVALPGFARHVARTWGSLLSVHRLHPRRQAKAAGLR